MNQKIEWTDFAEKVSSFTGIEASQLNQDTNIYVDLGVDSLGMFSLGLFLMKEYEIDMPLSSVAVIETIGDIYILMNKMK